MRLVRKIYRYRMEETARIRVIQDRNYRIRHAVAAITPFPYLGNQQALRVIREDVDRIDSAWTGILPQ